MVYGDERNTLLPGFPNLENRSFVVKLTRLFRLYLGDPPMGAHRRMSGLQRYATASGSSRGYLH